MSYLSKVLLVVAAFGLAACNNPDRFRGSDGMGGTGAGGIDSSSLGSAGDPRSVAYFQQSVGDRIFFAVDQSTLSNEARGTLGQQAQWLITNQGYAVVMEGHADEQGTRIYNLNLSEKRANAARDFLISQGVSPERVRTIGYGKERPVEVCSTEDCYSRNRRAVTVLSLGAGS